MRLSRSLFHNSSTVASLCDSSLVSRVTGQLFLHKSISPFSVNQGFPQIRVSIARPQRYTKKPLAT
jgi:hypothetical protein